MLAISPTFNQRALLGYSLIEVIVVLALLTLVTSIVIPNLSSTLDRYRLQSNQDEVLIQLSGLGYLAYQKQQSFVLYPDGDVGDVIDLPEGWAIELEDQSCFRLTGYVVVVR